MKDFAHLIVACLYLVALIGIRMKWNIEDEKRGKPLFWVRLGRWFVKFIIFLFFAFFYFKV